MTQPVRPHLLIIVIMSVAVLTSCNPGSGTADQSPKFQQYFNQGEQLYALHCSNCHQKTGTGLGRVYPPLNASDFVDTRYEEVICLIRHGRSGELTVNGKLFNQAMPPMKLSDLEIAEIATYIYNSWGRSRGLMEVSDVSAVLARCDSLPGK